MAEDNTLLRTVWVACQRTARKNALSTVFPLVPGANAPAAPQRCKFEADRKAWASVRGQKFVWKRSGKSKGNERKGVRSGCVGPVVLNAALT